MLTRRNVDYYAQSSGVGADIAERNVVLTYVLKILSEGKGEKPLLDELVFKGGTCLRKIYFGKTTRFSMDLDFTAAKIVISSFKDRFRRMLNNKEHYGINFTISDEFSRQEAKIASYGAIIDYAHEWNSSIFEVNVSFREKPCFKARPLTLIDELYFRYCEFKPFKVLCMQKEELIAEKLRAASQRLSSRDLYDLYVYANTSYNRDVVKALTIIKCWNVREPFDPDRLLNKIRNEEYDWFELRRLVRPDYLPTEKEVIKTVTSNYEYLKELNGTLRRIKADSRSHRHSDLVDSLISKLRLAYAYP